MKEAKTKQGAKARVKQKGIKETSRRDFRGTSRNEEDFYDGKGKGSRAKFTTTSNDPKWWLPNNITAQEVASYPWNTMAGFDISKTVPESVNAEEAPNLAGIMRLCYASSFPISRGESSALNRASLGLFADILTKNSSNTPFEHTDLMMSIIALSDIDAFIALGMRAYGLIRKYPVQNKYVGRALVNATGINYDSLIKDPYAFASRLNVYIARRNRFYIPSSFNWRKREVWINTNVYKDSDDKKSQFYVPLKTTYSKWSPRTSSTGSELLQYDWLETHSVDGYSITVESYFKILDEMLEPLENDQDIYIMQGYILKRYDMSQFVVMPNLDPDLELEPVIDYTVLTMIQNTKLYTDVYSLDGEELTSLSQNGGHFVYEPKFRTNVCNTGNILLTTCYNEPTPDETIEVTRDIIPVGEVAALHYFDPVGTCCEFIPQECNADYVHMVQITSLKSDGTPVTFDYDYSTWGVNVPLLSSDPTSQYLLTQISYFDFHPILCVQSQVDADASPKFIGYIGDFDNTMILPQESLAKLDNVLTYGIVNIVDILK